MKYLKVMHDLISRQGYIIDKSGVLNTVDAEFDGFLEYGEIGDQIIFEIIEMDETEFSNLKEFEGW
jgi:hypothetical protein